MNPCYDIVLSLLETPFSRRNEVEKQRILNSRPTPKITAILNEKRKGRDSTRTFQSSWYDNHQWLCGSFSKESLYCWPCLLLGNAKNSWCSKNGFRDLKNFSRNSKLHECTKEHIKNYLALRRLQQNRTTIGEALAENASLNKHFYNESVRKNRLLISYLIDVIITFGKQELAFGSQSQTVDFTETFRCLVKRNQELTEHCKKFSNVFTGQLEIIQSELISCIHEYLTDFVKSEVINECLFFGVIVDDITDVTDHSLCSITLRYVKNGCVRERFLGFFGVNENRTATVLCELLVAVLEPYNFREKLVAHCYDGNSVTCSELNNLQTKIKSFAPLALFTDCCAHKLSLLLQQGANQIDKSRLFFSALLSIPTYFQESPKCTLVLDKIIGKRIPWSVESTVRFVVNEWDKLILVFETIIRVKTSGSSSINAARGFLNNFRDFEFAILAKIYYEIFVYTDLLSQILRTKQLDLDDCSLQIKAVVQRISVLRNEEVFKNIFNYAKNITGLPNKPGKICGELEIFSRYKMLYYEIIDCISFQISTRFGNLQELEFLALVDSSKFSEYANSFPEKLFERLLQMYPIVFDTGKLKNELSIFYKDEHFRNLGVQKTVETLHNEFKMIFSETYKLFCIVLTIPTAFAGVDGDFSYLKRIQTYLRNTMTQVSSNNSSIMAIEKELLESLSTDPQFYEGVINKFANLKAREIDLFYKK